MYLCIRALIFFNINIIINDIIVVDYLITQSIRVLYEYAEMLLMVIYSNISRKCTVVNLFLCVILLYLFPAAGCNIVSIYCIILCILSVFHPPS